METPTQRINQIMDDLNKMADFKLSDFLGSKEEFEKERELINESNRLIYNDKAQS